ncbi:WD40 repeat domain-containing protein [Planctomycetes bacterium K23_9]|uniref:WD domain, G-beta repeat n=1 Tax=Stieleria marina TaxID=1930275 RepID=A0A517NTL8_9BACT|nr:WD domain, G-beta repeat [Planctomycetes bacterium K23_9]
MPNQAAHDRWPSLAYSRRSCSRRTALSWVMTGGILGSLSLFGTSSAQESSLTIAAKRRQMSDVLPIASRTVRLKPVEANLPRAVVTAITADPRGEVLAVSGDDHAIRIVDMESLNVLETLQGHRDLIRTMAFSPDGRKLVSAGNDGQLIVWSRDRDYRIQQRMQGTPALACVTFSPDGRQMAAVGFDNTVFMIGSKAGEQPVFKCDCKDLRTVAYRGDAKVLAVAGRSGDLHLFDPQSGSVAFEGPTHKGRIQDIEFWPGSGQLASVGDDGTAVVFDSKSMKQVNRIQVSTCKLYAVSILDRDHIAVAGSDNAIRIVDINEGATVRKLEGHQGSISALAFYNGRLFSGGFDATLRRWSVDQVTGKPERIAEGEHGIER